MTDWESLLREAASRVQKVSERLIGTSKGVAKVGRGAGGDKTLLVDMETENAALSVFGGMKELRVITEEKGEFGPKDARWTLILDPVDGSSNFERGIPFYCTSFAVLDGPRLKNAKYALVRNLANGEVYYSEAGRGSTKDGRRIKTSANRELSEAAITVDSCRATVPNITRTAPLIASVKRQAHFGANALEICFLAEGKMDSFVDVRGRMRVTDFAGGYLIAREAGAVVTSIDGGELDPKMTLSERFGLVASANEVLHGKVLEKVH